MNTPFPPWQTPRLRLEPVTADGVAMAIRSGHPPGWLIMAGGVVIGACGTHGPPDEHGCAEIGYGLAASFRGQGFGSEAVAAITAWRWASQMSTGSGSAFWRATRPAAGSWKKPGTVH